MLTCAALLQIAQPIQCDRRVVRRLIMGRRNLVAGSDNIVHGFLMPTLYEFAGGEEALHKLEGIFYSSVLADPLLIPLFGKGKPEHVDHLTAFTAESFGGPNLFSHDLGFRHLIDVHRGLRISEEQRLRFVELYMSALDKAGMPDDPDFRAAVLEHVEFGSQVAKQNSHATSESELHPIREVPLWTWSRDD